MRGKLGTGTPKRERTPEQLAKIEANRNRPFTTETKKIIRMWYSKGDSIEKIAEILDRSIESVKRALDE